MGEPFAKNVSVVIFGGPTCCMVGVGSITNSVLFEILSNPTNAMIIAIDVIPAPITREGPCINDDWNFLVHLVFCAIVELMVMMPFHHQVLYLN